MSIIYENFSSLPIGSTAPPPGWVVSFGNTLIQQGIKTDTPTSHVCRLSGTLFQYETFLFPPQSGTLQFWFAVTPGSIGLPVLCQLLATQISNNQSFPILTLFGETDSSLTIRVNNIYVNNTGQPGFYFQQGIFYWVQLNFTLTVDPTTQEIGYNLIQLAINGHKLIDNSLLHTGIFATSIQPDVTGISFQGALTGFTQLAEISFDTPNESIPHYPNLATVINAKLSQGVLEVDGLPIDANARVSQGAIELIELPNRSHARVSQGVIEIAAYTKVPTSGQGWVIKEV